AIVAMKIGELIRSLKYETRVPDYDPKKGPYCSYLPIPRSTCHCSSSCVLIYLSGVERFGSYLGIHRTFINHEYLRKLTMKEAKNKSNQISVILDAYLTKMGAPESLLEKMERVPSDQIEFLDYDFINKNLTGYAKGYEEWFIAKCGSNENIYRELGTETDSTKLIKLQDKYGEILFCQKNLLEKEKEAAFYPAIKSAFMKSNKSLIPRRSLMESMINQIPFDLINLVGKKTEDAMDLLSLIGIPNNSSMQELRNFNNEQVIIDNLMIITFEKNKVHSVRITFYESDLTKEFGRHFFNGFNNNSTLEQFIKKYGKPSRSYCRKSGVCTFVFSTANADLEIIFNADRTLRDIKVAVSGWFTKR
ncbi:MAG: hypothetical protein ACC656_13305, partial [Candidatus Heimdallarchaeota archaeon]